MGFKRYDVRDDEYSHRDTKHRVSEVERWPVVIIYVKVQKIPHLAVVKYSVVEVAEYSRYKKRESYLANEVLHLVREEHKQDYDKRG